MSNESVTIRPDLLGATPASNRVTVVVPVYGDWESLRECVASLIEHAQPAHYDVLLVNDCGPDADVIEAGLRGMIHGHPTFRYERNDKNLGFVKTCNRAVLELDQSTNDVLLLNSDTIVTAGALDELRDVLALSERHAVVCPRSNDATIASLPFFASDGTRPPERTKEVFDSIGYRLPRFYIAPIAVGFCFLIRRSLIENHGLFDEVFGKGYNEENDFCLRLNALGYSALIANQALVMHVGSSSFGIEQRAKLEAANSKVLRARYPFYQRAVEAFVQNEYTAIDRFSDLLVARPDRKPRVLVDLHHLSLTYNGSTKNALSFLKHISSLPGSRTVDITVAAQPDAIEFFALRSFNLRVVEFGEIDEVFDLGVSIAPVTSGDQLSALNRFCLRWLVSYLDIIALRSWDLRLQAPHKADVVRSALALADRVVAISQATVDDAMLFFPELAATLPSRVKVIHQGSGSEPSATTSSGDPVVTALESGYVLVVGNAFPHKQMAQALTALSATDVRLVVLGAPSLAEKFPSATVLGSGELTEADITTLYNRAALVVFPSAYEGFGLPPVEAVHHGKRVVAFGTDVMREVVKSLGLSDHVTYFDRFSELSRIVQDALSKTPASQPEQVRTLDDYNADLWNEVLTTAYMDVDLDRLTARDTAVHQYAAFVDPSSPMIRDLSRELLNIKSSRVFRLARGIASVTGPVKAAVRMLASRRGADESSR